MEYTIVVAASASESAAATMSPCSLENVGSRRKSRDASMMTLAARRAARTATARIGSEVAFIVAIINISRVRDDFRIMAGRCRSSARLRHATPAAFLLSGRRPAHRDATQFEWVLGDIAFRKRVEVWTGRRADRLPMGRPRTDGGQKSRR